MCEKPRRHNKLFTMLLLLLLAVGAVLLTWSVTYFVQRHAATQGIPVLTTEVITDDQQVQPDERKPNMQADYIVPADHPRRIIIDSLGVDGFVQRVGLTKEHAVGVPNNIHIAGWFIDSVTPGQPGLSIIDGHVGGVYTSDAIFKRLSELSVGATFRIEFGDLSIKEFAVVETKTLPEERAAEALFFKEPSIAAQLNLITCGGRYDTKRETYEERVIVVSRLINSQE